MDDLIEAVEAIRGNPDDCKVYEDNYRTGWWDACNTVLKLLHTRLTHDRLPESPLAPGEIDLAQRARAIVSHWDNHPGSPDSSGNLKAGLTGSPADSEVAELATAEMVRQLRTKAATEKANCCHYSSKLLTRAASLLERLSPPQPVPVPVAVSERLPEHSDCLIVKNTQWEMRYCWLARSMLHAGIERLIWEWKPLPMTNELNWPWAYWLPASAHLLPAHALPLPGEVEG